MTSISSAKNKLSFYMRPEDEHRVRNAFHLVRPGGRQGTLSHMITRALLSYVDDLEANYNDGQTFPDARTPEAGQIRTHNITALNEWPTFESETSTAPPKARFIPLEQVEEILSISRSQAYALVRSGDLRAIQVGGRGQWRVELTELEAYIQRCYAKTAAEIATESDEHE